MAKFIARAVVTLALLYGAAAAAFGYFHYEQDRPDVPTILGDFHAWCGALFSSTHVPKPAALPPSQAPEVGPPPAVTPPPEPPAAVSSDPEARELDRIEKEVLPKGEEAGRKLHAMERGDGTEWDRLRTQAMADLGEARTFLNGLLEKDAHHVRANRLWTRLQGLYAGLKKL